jgi:hypothetical protein
MEGKMSFKRIMGLVVAVLFLISATAVAGELGGVTMPDTLSVGGKALKLNGMGLRKKFGMKVYVGGLYLEAQSKDPAAIMAGDTAKAVTMQFVRDVDKGKLLDAFKEGFENNAKEKAAAQKENVEKFLSFVVDMKNGEAVTYTYDPAKGVTITKGGKEIGSIAGKDFAPVMFSLWLGPKPPSEDFKTGLLGK